MGFVKRREARTRLFICKRISTTVKLEITSLNSHYLLRELSTEFGSWVSMSEVYVIYTPGRHEKSGTEAPQGSLKNEQVSNGRVGYAWWNRRPQEQDRELKKNLS